MGNRVMSSDDWYHFLSNQGAIDCQFLLLQGGGKYDWIKLDG